MTPLHNMRRADLNIMAHILLRREEISKTCEDQSVIDELLFSTEERRRICERVGCKLTRLKQSLAQLRKCGAIINNAVNPKIIPQFAKGGDYLLIIHFDFNADD